MFAIKTKMSNNEYKFNEYINEDHFESHDFL